MCRASTVIARNAPVVIVAAPSRTWPAKTVFTGCLRQNARFPGTGGERLAVRWRMSVRFGVLVPGGRYVPTDRTVIGNRQVGRKAGFTWRWAPDVSNLLPVE